MSRRYSFLIVLMAPFLISWDTSVRGPENNQWTSMFIDPTFEQYANLSSGDSLNTGVLAGNEHQEFAHWAFQSLGWQGLYGPRTKTVDLNESLFHTILSETVPDDGVVSDFHYCDDEETPLAERCIPHPAAFAGVPDFSYSIYDWLNKNQFCPALPKDAEDYASCYVYAKWMGASLNSSHFGDQAEAIYRHFHKIALSLANNARTIRTQIVAAEAGGIYLEEAMELVLEAELEALAYEGYAQHFLQDRWASGHMWNRWNGPSFESVNGFALLDEHRILGAITGIIHGAEAVLRDISVISRDDTPGPMSSPVVNFFETEATPVTYKESLGGNIYPAVGDYRFSDVLNKSFGVAYGYSGIPLRVPQQELSMLICSKAGWADIARNFYSNGDNTFGAHKLPISGSTARFTNEDLEQAVDGNDATPCWSHWATNEAMSTGVSHVGQSSFIAGLLAIGATGSMLFKVGDSIPLSPIAGGEFGKMYYRIRAAAKSAPNGTDLAQGFSLGSLNGVQPGDAFVSAIPTPFHEPLGAGATPFEGLPEHAEDYVVGGDRPGRDKHTIMGFFNKAHARHWCEESRELLDWDDARTMQDPLQGLRMPVPWQPAADIEETRALQNRIDACVYLADRLYRGTKASYMPAAQQEYTGESAELHTSSHVPGDAATPTCEIIDALPMDLDVWEDNPYDLHPGYVTALNPDDPETGPYTVWNEYDDAHYLSLLNWCTAVPVVHVNSDDVASNPADGEPIVVTPGFDQNGFMTFAPSIIEPTITIYGYNFGPAAGRLKFVSENDCVNVIDTTPYADIVSWSDTEISFKVTGNRFPPDLYRITIIRADADDNGSKLRSVGRALLDVRRAVFTDVGNPGAALLEQETGRDHRAVHPFCTGGTVLRHEIWDCSAVSPAFINECGDPLLQEGTRIFNSGPLTFQPGPYDQHQWGVTQVGSCDSLVFPSAACPTAPPAHYGLIYRFERLSELTISVTAKLWRFTLAWERIGAP